MQHKTLDQIKEVAELHRSDATPIHLTRHERLARWAELLDRDPHRRLKMLTGTEYQATRCREKMRRDESPISIAFEDPVLREAGLRDDTYGAAKDFFGLSHRQLHAIVCYCHHGYSAHAHAAAVRVRAIMNRPSVSGLVARAWNAVAGR